MSSDPPSADSNPPPVILSGNDSGESGNPQRKPVWDKPSTSAADGASAAVIDEHSWPALSESTKPSSSKSPSDFLKNDSSSVPSPSLEPLISQPPVAEAAVNISRPVIPGAAYAGPRFARPTGGGPFRARPAHIPRPISPPLMRPPPFPAMVPPYAPSGARPSFATDHPPLEPAYVYNSWANPFPGMFAYQPPVGVGNPPHPAVPQSFGHTLVLPRSDGHPSCSSYGQDFATPVWSPPLFGVRDVSFQPYRPAPGGYTHQLTRPFYGPPHFSFSVDMSQQMYVVPPEGLRGCAYPAPMLLPPPRDARPAVRLSLSAPDPVTDKSQKEAPGPENQLKEYSPGPAESSRPKLFFSISFPPNAPLPRHVVAENLIRQINYYFSDENMASDHFLRGNMDCKGWVLARIIATFDRVAKMMVSVKFIIKTMKKSTVVEVKKKKLRARTWAEENVLLKDSSDDDDDDDDDEEEEEVGGSGLDGRGEPNGEVGSV